MESATDGAQPAAGDFVPAPATLVDQLLRMLAVVAVVSPITFLINNYMTFWHDWPGVMALYEHWGFFGEKGAGKLEDAAVTQGSMQLVFYVVCDLAAIVYVLMTPRRNMMVDSAWMSALAAFIIRAAFWGTLLVGLADMVISFLRVEALLEAVAGEELTKQLGRPSYRGTYVHYPLMLLSCVIAFFVRSLGFIWLTLLVVFAEFQIVIWRFVFSYEQAFMGDLVRFWYAALFLFASAYTLVQEGHVRVDVFYARFSDRGKAWANSVGSVVLGLPLCWTILSQGMWGKGSSLNSPLLSFEISQSGYGLYVKYLMAGFLVVFAVSMIVQFASYFLSNSAVLRRQAKPTLAEAVAH